MCLQRYKNSCRQSPLLLGGTVRQKPVRTAPPEKRGVPGCMLVLQAYPSAIQPSPAPESDHAFSPCTRDRKPCGVTPSMFGHKKWSLCLEERREPDCIVLFFYDMSYINFLLAKHILAGSVHKSLEKVWR